MAKVFLMEDEPNISFVVETILTSEGHNVTAENNGIAGLATLARSSKPDIVLLDLNLPGLSGREIAKKMKATPEWKDIPIIIMSGCMDFSKDFPPKDCYEAVLTKPFDIMEMVSMVNTFTTSNPLLASISPLQAASGKS